MRWTVMCLLAAVGCEVAVMCTDMGCQGELEVELPAATLAEGEYVVELELGDTVESCLVTRPSEGDAGETTGDCVVAVDGDIVWLLFPLPMGAEPERIPVTITASEEIVATGVAVPSWEDPYYPNGEQCDDVCYRGVASIVLD